MPPKLNSRYQYSRAWQDDDDIWFLDVPFAFRFTNQKDNRPYTMTVGDNLQILAYRFYRGFSGAPQLWRAIAEFNDIVDATAPIPSGKVIIVPSLRWIKEVYLMPPANFRDIESQLGVNS